MICCDYEARASPQDSSRPNASHRLFLLDTLLAVCSCANARRSSATMTIMMTQELIQESENLPLASRNERVRLHCLTLPVLHVLQHCCCRQRLQQQLAAHTPTYSRTGLHTAASLI